MALQKLALMLVSGSLLFADGPVKVGFVYVSPIGDAGYTYQHDLARKEVEKEFKGKVTARVIESVEEGADAERVIRSLASEGCKMIFATSFGYMNPTAKVAAAFPNVEFFHATGYKSSKNMATYNGRFYEGRYLNGIIAGKMTKTHVAGFVAAFPIPEVMMAIDAFTQGMRSVDPKAQVHVVWVNSWFDPGKEREATISLISQGADMITQHTDSTVVVQTVEEQRKAGKNVFCFSYNSDMIKYAPTSQLSGDITDWAPYYVRTVKNVLAGKGAGPNVWDGVKEGMIKIAPYNKAVPQAVRTEVNKAMADMKAGKLSAFQGPVLAQDGTVKVPKGQVMSDKDLGAINYYVQGVVGTVPKG
ncbi:MAG: BMP family ABC transporter substrate-binding protein [Holophaga sp.]|nr:BMP family ABC transporter substrate-binding protein [Holophaga sp.]